MRLSIYMRINTELYSLGNIRSTFKNEITMTDVELILQSSVSGTDYVNGDMPKTIKNRSKSLIKSGEYASMVEVFYASSMLKDKLHLKSINHYNATKVAGCRF
mgnify:CR=1 FL=1